MVIGASRSRATTVASTVLKPRSFSRFEFGFLGVLEHAEIIASAPITTATAAKLRTLILICFSLSVPAHPLDFRSRPVERLPGGLEELDRNDASLIEEGPSQGGKRPPELPEFLRHLPLRLARASRWLIHGYFSSFTRAGPARPLPERDDDRPVLHDEIHALQKVDVGQ